MAAWVETPVGWRPPSLKLRVIAASRTPRPTCAGLVPPNVPLGAEPLDRICETWVWKVAVLAL